MAPHTTNTLAPARWLRASRTVAPSLAILGALLVSAEAFQRLSDIASWEARSVLPNEDLYAFARRDAWTRVAVGVAGGLLGLLLAFVRSARLAWSLLLGSVGLTLILEWGLYLNAIPFGAAAVLAWARDDPRLHPETGPVSL